MTTKTTPRLTKTEQRAVELCEQIRQGYRTYVTIEWRKSRTWGSNPHIDFGGDCVSVSGCGYCKESTALAEALRFLGGSPEAVSAIWQTGGAGVFSVASALKSLGWHLEKITGTTTTDTYRIERITE